MVIAIAILACVATFLGGFFAIRLSDKLHSILGFSAGAVIAVAFFDLMPESFDLGHSYFSPEMLVSYTALGFVVYLILDRVIFLHSHAENDEHDSKILHVVDAQGHHHDHALRTDTASVKARGVFGAGSLSVHSFLDGLAIGLSFQVSASVGLIVTLAVLTHDFSDGINTVSLILKNGGEKKLAFRWLTIDAIAPVLGAFSTLFFTVPEKGLAILLALFAGFFLFIGASDLIPESQHAHPKFMTTAMTVLGVAVMYVVIHIASI